jgi:hypothetical protein
MLSPIPMQQVTVRWLSSVVDIEPGTRYGYRSDAANVNTTMLLRNDTSQQVSLQLAVLLTDPDENDPPVPSVRRRKTYLEVEDLTEEERQVGQWLAGLAQAAGADPKKAEEYAAEVIAKARRAYKTKPLALSGGEEALVRFHQRQRLYASEQGVFTFNGFFPVPPFAVERGGDISLMVAIPRTVPGFSVEPTDWTKNFSPQAFGVEGNPLVAMRHVFAWYWRNDPELSVSYRYV